MDTQLIQELCEVRSPSGEEAAMKDFLLAYVRNHQHQWQTLPEIHEGEHLQDAFMLKFGEPRTAVFVHMDTIGFTVRYANQLVPVGSPDVQPGYRLVGADRWGPVECDLDLDDDNRPFYRFGRGVERGTTLTYKPDFRQDDQYVQCCYLDNRLGLYTALKLAETLRNGLIVFSCWEEHGGGSVPCLARYMHEQWAIRQCLVADITWVTDGVRHGEGVVISMRDRGIPRRSYLQRVMDLADASGIPYQLEVEGGGSSDARELQASPYPLNWCFVGAAEDHVHTPGEKVHKQDLAAMVDLYRYLMDHL